MPVSEKERLALYEQMSETIGPIHAGTLMEYLPPKSWDELATKDDLRLTAKELRAEMHELRAEMHEFRAEMQGLRAEMQLGFATIESRFATVESGFATIESRFATVESGFAKIESRIAQHGRTMMLAMTGFALTIWVSLLVVGIT